MLTMNQSVKQYIKLIPKVFIFLGFGLTLFHFAMGGVKPQYFFKQGILNGCASVILWVGNGIIADYLNEKIPLIEHIFSNQSKLERLHVDINIGSRLLRMKFCQTCFYKIIIEIYIVYLRFYLSTTSIFTLWIMRKLCRKI